MLKNHLFSHLALAVLEKSLKNNLLATIFKIVTFFTPLTENHFAKKPLAERGVPPPPLTGKIP